MKRRKFRDLTPGQRTTGNFLLMEEELAFPLMVAQCRSLSFEAIYTKTTTMDSTAYIYFCIHVHT